MPVLSYLAYPARGQKEKLTTTLAAMPECEVIESENEDLLILVTSVDGEEAERNLEKRLDQVESLSMLTLVFGHRADALTSSPESSIPQVQAGGPHAADDRRRRYVSAPKENV